MRKGAERQDERPEDDETHLRERPQDVADAERREEAETAVHERGSPTIGRIGRFGRLIVERRGKSVEIRAGRGLELLRGRATERARVVGRKPRVADVALAAGREEG